MSKIEKKRQKLIDRIKFLEDEMYSNLKQKTSNTAEISVSKYTSEISALMIQLKNLK
jgi:hypothetical protein